MYEIDLFVSKYDGSQKLWLQHFPSDENPLTSGAVLVPGTGLDLLNTWTVLQSVGSDLSTSLNSGLTVDSTAGGQFMASWYVNIQILSRLIP